MYDAEFVAQLEQTVQRALPVWSLSSQTDVSLLNLSENATWLLREPESGR